MVERHAITVAGERLELLAHRAIHWPARRTLIVADLHWGKCETFRTGGVPVPAGVIEADLARLAAALDATEATRLLVLGDLLHAGAGLTPMLVGLVARWLESRRVELVLVPGNHDRCGVPREWNAKVTLPECDEGPFLFRHDPGAAGSPRPRSGGPYTLCGHIHPMVTLSNTADSVRLPCFVFGSDLGMLPSFSLFTRGISVGTERSIRIFAIAGDQIVPLQRATEVLPPLVPRR